MGRPIPLSDEAAKEVDVWEVIEKTYEGIEIRKEDMNRLVMNFFVKEGFIDAAKKFEEESGTKYTAPPAWLIDRKAVKDMLTVGGVDEAIKMVCNVDPQIIHSNMYLQYHLHQEKFIDLLGWESLIPEKVKEALDFAHDKIVPIVEKYPEDFSEDFEISMTSLLNASEGNYEALHGRTAMAVMSMDEAILQRQIDQEWLTIPYILKMLYYVGWQIHSVSPYYDELMKIQRLWDMMMQ